MPVTHSEIRPVALPKVATTTRTLPAITVRGGANQGPTRFASPPFTLPLPSPPKSPVEITLDVLEGRFRPVIVWQLFWGAKPFSELMRMTSGISKKVLRRELVDMERLGLIRRDVPPGSNRKAKYSLTPLAEGLKFVVGAMYQWGLQQMTPLRSSHAAGNRSPESAKSSLLPRTGVRASPAHIQPERPTVRTHPPTNPLAVHEHEEEETANETYVEF